MATKATLSPLWKEALATTEEQQSQLNQITDWFMGEQQKVQATADYDISQAYAAYKKQTMQAMNTASMAEGTKERIAREGYGQYQNTASQINEGLAESNADITTNYNKLLSNWQSNLEKRADMSAQLEEALWNYADEWGLTEYTEEDAKQGYNNWYSKYYSEGMEQERKEILENVMYGDIVLGEGNEATKIRLSNELAQANPELYDFYVSNQDYFNKMLLGIDEPGYRGEGYNWNNRTSVTEKATELEQKAQELGFNTNRTFDNQTEKEKYYDILNRTYDLMNKIKNVASAKQEYEDLVEKEIDKMIKDKNNFGNIMEYNKAQQLPQKYRTLFRVRARERVNKDSYKNAKKEAHEILAKLSKEDQKIFEENKDVLEKLFADVGLNKEDFKEIMFS